MFNGLLQPTHLIIILVIVLIIFGPRRLPEIGGAVGKSIREFRKSTKDMTNEFQQTVDDIKQPAEDVRNAISLSPAAATSGKVCPKCSAGNVSASKFCASCGSGLT